MMDKNILILLFSIVFFGHSINAQDSILMTINGKDISKSSFEYLYHKNNTNTSGDKKTLEEYLDLFVNFKLKVAEAELQQLDTAKTFKAELDSYRRQSSKPYFIDGEYKLQLEKEAYERMKEDVELAHIFIKLNNTVIHDTLDSYNRAVEIAKRVQTEDFEAVAKEVSEDSDSKEKGGYLGYMIALKTVYSFEDAVYNTPIGGVSGVIRSMNGYHIVKVYGRRPSQGKFLLSHILKLTNDSTPKKNIIAKNDITILYDKIRRGEDFGELAKKHSDDKNSAKVNGELPWVQSGNLIKEFEDVAFGLKTIGEVSKPVKTRYGWHIIKLKGKKPLGSFEELFPEIERAFSRGDRVDLVSKHFQRKLKKEYNYSINQKALAQIEKIAKELSDSLFYVKGVKLKKPLFTFADRVYSQSQFVKFMKEKKIPSLSYMLALDKYSYLELMSYENSVLEEKYPEFRHLIEEYRDGILLFNISNTQVWGKAMNDKEGLKAFYERNKKNYTWEAPRYKGRIISCKNKIIELQVREILKTSPTDSIDSSLRKLNNDENVVKSENGLFVEGSNEIVDFYAFKKGSFQPTKEFPVVFVEGKLLNGPECYEDIKGKVIQDYQAYLDKEWIKKLREKFPVNINKELLETIE